MDIKPVPPATTVKGRGCPYYPCHPIDSQITSFDCEYCFCPLYDMGEKCGGNFVILSNGIKDCSYCLRPHTEEGKQEVQNTLNSK